MIKSPQHFLELSGTCPRFSVYERSNIQGFETKRCHLPFPPPPVLPFSFSLLLSLSLLIPLSFRFRLACALLSLALLLPLALPLPPPPPPRFPLRFFLPFQCRFSLSLSPSPPPSLAQAKHSWILLVFLLAWAVEQVAWVHTGGDHLACYQAFDARGMGSLMSAVLAAAVVIALVFGERRRNGP